MCILSSETFHEDRLHTLCYRVLSIRKLMFLNIVSWEKQHMNDMRTTTTFN